MKPLIASFLLVASAGSAFEPWLLVGRSGSEVALLMIWGVALLAAGRLIRARVPVAGGSKWPGISAPAVGEDQLRRAQVAGLGSTS